MMMIVNRLDFCIQELVDIAEIVEDPVMQGSNPQALTNIWH